MSKHHPECWECDNCSSSHPYETDIWLCPGCSLEVCEWCFSSFAHCKKCSEGVVDDVLIENANNAGWEFQQ